MIHPATGNTTTPTNHHSTLIVHDPSINPFRHHHAPPLTQTNKPEGQHSNHQPADHLRLRAEGTHHLEIRLNTNLTDRHIHTIRTHRGGIHSEPPRKPRPQIKTELRHHQQPRYTKPPTQQETDRPSSKNHSEHTRSTQQNTTTT